MSSSSSHPTWVYPPPGAPTNDIQQTSNFGPVHVDDKMILQWTPNVAVDAIELVCFSESHDWITWTIAQDQGQPFEYEFVNQAKHQNSSDFIFCHFWFTPQDTGNTVRWQFMNDKANKVQTFSGPDAPQAVATTLKSALSTAFGIPQSSTVGSPASDSTGSAPSSSSSTKSTSTHSPGATLGQSSQSLSAQKTGGNSLSAGASAGIGVGVALAVLAIVGALMFFVRRGRKKRSRQGDPAVDEKRDNEPGGQANDYHEEMHDSSRHELGGCGVHEIEGDARKRIAPVELGGSIPSH